MDESAILASVECEWRGLELWWCIKGEWISDHDLRKWWASNAKDDMWLSTDVVRRHHIQAYAERDL